MRTTVGIIGYGMVGQTMKMGFYDTVDTIIVDPLYSNVTVEELCERNPQFIFVCVPTPEHETQFTTLTHTLEQIKDCGYTGITVVKSTVLPQFLEPYDVVFNPEFLSRATALDDLLSPPYVVVAGDRCAELVNFYAKFTPMDVSRVYYTDIPTAAFIKYTANAFYALKVTYMNEMHAVAEQMGADFNIAGSILCTNPAFGNNHVTVPGADGKFGFGGPCLPKDTAAIVREYSPELLALVIKINNKIRE